MHGSLLSSFGSRTAYEFSRKFPGYTAENLSEKGIHEASLVNWSLTHCHPAAADREKYSLCAGASSSLLPCGCGCALVSNTHTHTTQTRYATPPLGLVRRSSARVRGACSHHVIEVSREPRAVRRATLRFSRADLGECRASADVRFRPLSNPHPNPDPRSRVLLSRRRGDIS